jgi:hypothetical protein
MAQRQQLLTACRFLCAPGTAAASSVRKTAVRALLLDDRGSGLDPRAGFADRAPSASQNKAISLRSESPSCWPNVLTSLEGIRRGGGRDCGGRPRDVRSLAVDSEGR